ncbi:MAG TPA: DUF6113 family protein [Nocardioidaceae bacterium]|nr:DUF6113 family protein [Nocardioidaceae bacterium]
MSLLRHVGSVLLGAVVALTAVAVHRSAFPWGLVLGLVTTFAVLGWILRCPAPRAAASYVVGWVLLLAAVLVGRPEGDYALAGDLDGYALIGAGVVLVPVGIVALLARRPRS